MAVLQNIVDAHSKCSKAFLLLEYGVLSFSHLIMIRRVMYYHHIINRDTKWINKEDLYETERRYLKRWLVWNPDDWFCLHIFENCEPLRQSLKSQHRISINKIYGSVYDQKEAIVIFDQIDDQRKLLNIDILPGWFVARTPA